MYGAETYHQLTKLLCMKQKRTISYSMSRSLLIDALIRSSNAQLRQAISVSMSTVNSTVLHLYVHFC